MSAQELTVYVPDGGEWRQRTGNICYIEGENPCPDVSASARRLSVHDRFEVTDIPGAMAKMGWHTSAALLNKWFHCSPKNQAMTFSEKLNGYSEDGSRHYPDHRIDRSTIQLDWVLSHPRVKAGYDKLANDHAFLKTDAARDALTRKLRRLKDRDYIDTLAETNGDIAALHAHFQFQRLQIDTSALEKAAVFFRAMLNYGMPDDLAGALGGFGLYAAPAKIRIRPALIGSGKIAEVTHIAIYVKNPYSFFDDPTESASQYLGHWNREGICLVPEGYVAQWANFGSWSNYIIQPEGPYGRTYWPVHNSDFRRWQNAHNAGGDMILFSDYRIERVFPSIRVRI
ncbi:DUF6402 family protein [Paraburkholderia silviterrae]|uniref:Uncharacterized protein n=1 Tax=Paraburkholderia silviterrae TaxID=2528715 RepID=A0A4R5MFU7_9BURK|nr:DUF6402 family protein [Paraburkholderia silviterrae]TDG26165.1 hypothetical protein EYW47_02080 [Paraburkholderia silviterrae]